MGVCARARGMPIGIDGKDNVACRKKMQIAAIKNLIAAHRFFVGYFAIR